MKQEILKKWEPIDHLPEEMYLEGLHDDYEGFRLLMKGKNPQDKMLRIHFEVPLVYRNIDEGDYLLYSPVKNESAKSTFYTIENSQYLEWFHKESLDMHKSEKIIHYAIYTPNDCIDILSPWSPKVEWLNGIDLNSFR